MYSQNNEESLIRSHFGASKGVCLDLGANDGQTLSNTRACMERGWSGVLVDASPRAFAKLEALYIGNEKAQCLNVAVGMKDGTFEFHDSGEHLGKGDSGLLSTLLECERFKWRSSTTYDLITVPCVTFATLLKMTSHEKFDLISIDIEGMDLRVLQQMDLDALGCRMLIVEHNGRDEDLFHKEAEKYGMTLKARNPENLIYVR